MKRLILILTIAFLGGEIFGQVAFVVPVPTGADAEMTLFIDVSQTTQFGLKDMLAAHPDDDVYLWIWSPSAPVTGNGAWGDSSDGQLMTHEGGMLYSMTFIPTQYFGVDAPTFYNNGISCLAKLKDGNAYSDEFEQEAKTEDLHVDITPKLCDSKFCVFPQVAQENDFITITYNNNEETISGLMNVDPNEAYVYMSAFTGPFTFYAYVPASDVTMTPELKMTEDPNKPGVFTLTFVPKDFWANIIPAGEIISEVRYYLLIPNFNYPGSPPFQLMPMLDCSE